MKAGETRADIFEKIGGSGGGARKSLVSPRTPKGKALTKKRKADQTKRAQAEVKKMKKGKQSAEKTGESVRKIFGEVSPHSSYAKMSPTARGNAATKARERARAKRLEADKKKNPSKYVGKAKKSGTDFDRDRLYGDWLPKGEQPMTVKSTPSAAQIKKASKDYY